MSTASVTNTFVNAATADADEVNTNFSDLVTFLNGSVVHTDGSKAFTGVQSGVTPTAGTHLATKYYVDGIGEQAILYFAADYTTFATGSSYQQIPLDTQLGTANTTYYTVDLGNSRVDIAQAGLYMAIAQVRYDTNATGERAAGVYMGGTHKASNFVVATSGSSYTRCNAVGVRYLTAGANIYLAGFQNSGANRTLYGGDVVDSTFLTVVRISGGV